MTAVTNQLVSRPPFSKKIKSLHFSFTAINKKEIIPLFPWQQYNQKEMAPFLYGNNTVPYCHLSENLFAPLLHPIPLSFLWGGKCIYKPSPFEPKWSGYQVLSFPLISTTLSSYPPTRNWRSTAVQKVASHYFSFGGGYFFSLFALLLPCYHVFCFFFVPSLSFYLPVTGNPCTLP